MALHEPDRVDALRAEAGIEPYEEDIAQFTTG